MISKLLKPGLWLGVLTLSALYGQVQVTVTPAAVEMHIGNEQQFTATVTGSADRAITWAVDSVAGGDATVGRIATNGRYTPPAVLPARPAVAVYAVHESTGVVSKGAVVTLLNPYPILASVRPGRLFTGPFAVTVNGSGFTAGSRVRLGSMDLATTFVSATRLVAAGTLPAAASGALPLAVTNPDPGSQTSVSIGVAVNAPCAAS